jgi:hypothetical protein
MQVLPAAGRILSTARARLCLLRDCQHSMTEKLQLKWELRQAMLTLLDQAQSTHT